MSLFRKIVEVEKTIEVERVVPGAASRVRLFEAHKQLQGYVGYSYVTLNKVLGYYLSCTEAFAAHPGCDVREVEGIRIGKEYFHAPGLTAVTVTRPKRAKGRGK